jgi:hypothetical protein
MTRNGKLNEWREWDWPPERVERDRLGIYSSAYRLRPNLVPLIIIGVVALILWRPLGFVMLLALLGSLH